MTRADCERCGGSGVLLERPADCWWCHGTEDDGTDPCRECRPAPQPCDACEVDRERP